jgi:hypothetical protein
MAMTDERKQRSNRLQAHVPSGRGRRSLSHGVKTTRPFLERLAHAQRAPRESPVPSH